MNTAKHTVDTRGQSVISDALSATGWTVSDRGTYVHAERPLSLGRSEELAIVVPALDADLSGMLSELSHLPSQNTNKSPH